MYFFHLEKQTLKTDNSSFSDDLEWGALLHCGLECKLVQSLGRAIWQMWSKLHIHLKQFHFLLKHSREVPAHTFNGSNTAMGVTCIILGYIFTHRYEYMHVFLKVLGGYTLNLW